MRNPERLHKTKIPRVTNLPRLPPAPVLRMFLLALCAVIASAWALVRYYERAHPAIAPPSPSSIPSEIPIEPE